MNKKLKKYSIAITDYKDNHNEHLTPLQNKILNNRINNDFETDYVYPGLDITKDMYTLKDLDKAGELFAKHIKNGSKIAVAVDSDSDGINSGAVVSLALTNIFGLVEDRDFVMFVNRRRQGNGFNKTLVSRIVEAHKEYNFSLVTTFDHGSSDNIPLRTFIDLGMEVLLTDHHEIPKDNYPESATVFVNNQRSDSEYTTGVSGCFIGLLTMIATYDKLYGNIDIEKFYFLYPNVAITTISDVMPLNIPINRAMVHYGMNEMNSSRNFIWEVLKELLGINTIVDSTEIGFKLAPLINTANRVNSEDLAYYMLTAKTDLDCRVNAVKLIKLSKYRKAEQKKLYKDAVNQVLSSPYKNTITLLLESPLAIGGIISGQIGETYNTPTVCFLMDDSGNLTGSGRGIFEELDLVHVFRKIHEEDDSIFVKFGGHRMAAGSTIKPEKYELFRKLFDKYVSEQIGSLESSKMLYIDEYLDNDDITPNIVKEIALLEPYGKDWLQPTFATTIKLKYYNIYGSMGRFVFKTNKGRELEAMYFFNKNSTYSSREITEMIRNGDRVMIVFKIAINNFNKKTNLQLNLVDVRKL